MTDTQETLRNQLFADLAYQILLTQGLSPMKVAGLPSCNQLLVLKELDEVERMRLTDLSAALKLSPSTITGVCDVLEQKGYIRRDRDLIDRRIVYVSLTAHGRMCLRSTRDSMIARLGSVAHTFKEGDLETAVAVLNAINRSLHGGLS
ncbi:MarR family winged helix-turn-helix transcriptional regulator [Alicyclobacillus suci]|uniref:MarR family winged helix-turn-helix transcriptional regulator n=1 Tax=Alicyclobacillus suci TaxID=2816080 RepID=UPI001A8F1B51|nr:MarR family transcriptional regulator [Alicyclobacillus suci]